MDPKKVDVLNMEGNPLKPEYGFPIYSPICTSCRHLNLSRQRSCKAFPDGIPQEIWSGQNDHRSAFEGDGGIRFELP